MQLRSWSSFPRYGGQAATLDVKYQKLMGLAGRRWELSDLTFNLQPPIYPGRAETELLVECASLLVVITKTRNAR